MARNAIRWTGSALLLATALAGCASVPKAGTAKLQKELDVVAQSDTHGMDPIAQAAFWGTRFDRDQNNPKIAAQYSKSLRMIGNNAESLRVAQHAQSRLGDDADLLLELGKSLIANERAHEAIRPIQTAIVLGKDNDWSAHSAYGVALDRIGEHRQALIAYDRALALAPGQPQVLNNKGLSYALSGRKDLAAQTLRTATSQPGGTARIRQNYALVLALSGDTQSAERLARSDLPPTIADGNVAYYRSLVAQPAYWQSLDGENAVQPDFGEDPSTISTTPLSTPVMVPGGPVPARTRTVPPAKPTPTPQPKAPTPSASAALPSTNAQSVAAKATDEPVTLQYEH